MAHSERPIISRRRFVQGLVVGAARGGIGLWHSPSFAQEKRGSPTILRGIDFNLEIGAIPTNSTGTARLATSVNGHVPAPALYWREGDTVTLRVTNRLPHASSICWHGNLVPANMARPPRTKPRNRIALERPYEPVHVVL